MDNCPIKPPKLVKAQSRVESCNGCGRWIERYPSFMGDRDDYWQCEKCGCTSVKIRDGRPYGPKSHHWDNVVKRFEEMYLDIPHWDWDTVETVPSMKELDWEVIEKWFRSYNIYRTFWQPFTGIVIEVSGAES
jgi:ribosomal protein S27AE